MAERSFVILVVGLAVLGLSCGRAGRAPRRLALHAVESYAVNPGGVLALSGEGLPVGAAAHVALHGVLHAPGQRDRAVEAKLSGRVLSPERLTAAFALTWPRVRHGTFEGELEVGCEQSHASWFGALAAVSFDLESPLAGPSDRLRRDALAVLRSLGIELSDDTARTHGVLVARLEADGVAARMGLLAGDVIESANGVRVQALSDLAPEPSAARLHLQVRRGAAERQFALLLPAASPFHDPRLLGLYCLACPVLMLLLRVLPLPSASTLARRSLARAQVLLERRVPLAFGSGLVCACLAATVPAILAVDIDVFEVLVAHAVLSMLAQRKVEDWAPRARRLLMLWSGVASVAAISGTRSWAAIVADQGAWPWEWNVLARWPAAVGLALCLWHAAHVHAASSAAPKLIDMLGAGVLCGLFAALFLGGAPHGLLAGRAELALTSAIAASKAVAVLAVMSVLPAPRQLGLRVHALWFATLLAATAAWLWFAPSRRTELMLGGGACSFLLLLAFCVFIERRLLWRRGVEPAMTAAR